MRSRIFIISAICLILGIATVYSWNAEKGSLEGTSEPTTEVKFSENLLREGDVIFQTSNSGQSLAIQISTNSKYSHCGMLFKEGDEWMVYEAVQPIKRTPLAAFIDRGDDGFFSITRLSEKDALSEEKIQEMKTFFNEIEGKDYDIYFDWSDKRWYCSELVWKMYDEVGIKISEYEKFGDFDLSHPVVQEIVAARFPQGPPLEETVITPKGIHTSKKMVEIYSNYKNEN